MAAIQPGMSSRATIIPPAKNTMITSVSLSISTRFQIRVSAPMTSE